MNQDYVYTSSQNPSGNLNIYNIEDINNPSLLSESYFNNYAIGHVLHADESRLYACSPQGYPESTMIEIYDTSNPADPEFINQFEIDNVAFSSILFNEHKMIFLNAEQITSYSLEDASSPQVEMIIDAQEIADVLAFDRLFELKDNKLLISSWKADSTEYSHLQVIDLNHEESWEVIAYYPIRYLEHAGFTDNGLVATWRGGCGLFSLDFNTVEQSDEASLPTNPSLAIFPNPANPTSQITLNLPYNDNVEVKVFDLLGREIMTLHTGYLSVGLHQFTFSPDKNLASGIYLLRASSNDWNLTNKIILMK